MSGFYHAIESALPETVRAHLMEAKLSSPPVMADFPYVVVRGTPENEYSGSGPRETTLGDRPDVVYLDLRFTYAAMNADSLSIVIRNTRRALTRAAVQVSGYRCELSRLSSLQPITTDRDITISGAHPVFVIDEARLTAHKL